MAGNSDDKVTCFIDLLEPVGRAEGAFDCCRAVNVAAGTFLEFAGNSNLNEQIVFVVSLLLVHDCATNAVIDVFPFGGLVDVSGPGCSGAPVHWSNIDIK